MKVFKKSIFSVLAAVVAFGASSHVFGAGLPVYTDLGDTGTLEIDSNPPAFPPGVASLGHPYSNTAITAPVITPLSTGNGWVLTFTLNSNFFATANNHGGSGETTTMDGKLDFELTFPTAIAMTANIVEGGIYKTTGNGTVGVGGGAVIAEAIDPISHETITNGNLGNSAVFNPVTGGWSSFEVTGFQHSYLSYEITLDNILTAESLASPIQGSAMIAKKQFSIVVTTDGTTGGAGAQTPEPASLGFFTIGALALLKRRRA